MKDLIAIAIPIYKPFEEISPLEEASLVQCFKTLRHYPIFFVGPEGLDVSNYIELAFANSCNSYVTKFPSYYFRNISGYNKLMLTTRFYRSFVNFEYILLYQTDAWIFKDNLIFWCDKGYDYIGSPWIDWYWSEHNAKFLTFPRRILSKLGYKEFKLVGNGGLSLRKVSSFIFNLKVFNKQAENFTGNEDYFFSFWLSSYNPFFKIPSEKEALKFSFDENPEIAYLRNNYELPMACHAWPKYLNFWEKFIIP